MSLPFQPRYGEDAYPISRLIVERVKTLGLSRTEFVRRLGYTNLGSGHQALTDLLIAGSLAPLIAKHLAAALEVEQSVVGEAIAATNAQRAEEARARGLAVESTYPEKSPHETAEVIGDNELVIDSFEVNNGMYRWQTYNSFLDADLTETDQVEKNS